MDCDLLPLMRVPLAERRMGMVLVLILFWTCVYGLPLFKCKEGQDLVLKWDCPRTLDLSALSIDCSFVNNILMLHVVEGEVRFQDDRVQYDRETLKHGQVQLRITNLTVLDSGKYSCYMFAEKESWMSLEHFVILVLPSKTITATTSPGVQPANAVTKQTESHGSYRERWGILAVGFLALFLIFGLCFGKQKNIQSPTEARQDMQDENFIDTREVGGTTRAPRRNLL